MRGRLQRSGALSMPLWTRASTLVMFSVLAVTMGMGCSKPKQAATSVTMPVWGALMDARGDTAIVMGSTRGISEWAAFVCTADGRSRPIDRGAGLPVSVALSPDGSQALLCWATLSAGVHPRRVKWVGLRGPDIAVLGEFADQTIPSRCAWNPGGTAWLSRDRRMGGGYLLHRARSVVRLPEPRLREGVQHGGVIVQWPSEAGDCAYVLRSCGVVCRVSPNGATVAARLALPEDARAAPWGDRLFVLSHDRLARVDVGSGAVESKEIVDNAGALRRVHQLLPVSQERLVATAWGRDDLETFVWGLRYPDLEPQSIGTVAAGPGLVQVAGDRERLWVAWTDEERYETIVTSWGSLP